jgi:hypothetical protein
MVAISYGKQQIYTWTKNGNSRTVVKVLTLVLDYVEIVSDDLNTWNSVEHTFELHVLVSGENCKNT